MIVLSMAGRTNSRKLGRADRDMTLFKAFAKATGSRALTRQPSSPPIRAATSPTSTDTTGVLQASASLTMFGDPSLSDVTITTLAAFKYKGTLSCVMLCNNNKDARHPSVFNVETAASASSRRLTGSLLQSQKRTHRILSSSPSSVRQDDRSIGRNFSKSTPVGIISTWVAPRGRRDRRFSETKMLLATLRAANREHQTPTRCEIADRTLGVRVPPCRSVP